MKYFIVYILVLIMLLITSCYNNKHVITGIPIENNGSVFIPFKYIMNVTLKLHKNESVRFSNNQIILRELNNFLTESTINDSVFVSIGDTLSILIGFEEVNTNYVIIEFNSGNYKKSVEKRENSYNVSDTLIYGNDELSLMNYDVEYVYDDDNFSIWDLHRDMGGRLTLKFELFFSKKGISFRKYLMKDE